MVRPNSSMRLLALSTITFLAAGLPVSAQQVSDFTFRRPCMGTVWRLKLYAEDEDAAKEAAEAAFARVEALNAVLSDYLQESELSRLSATAGTGKPMTVSGDLLAVLRLSQAAAVESGGVFDITIGPCVQLWRKSRKSHTLPSPEDIQSARQSTGWESLALDETARTALLKKPGMRLDTGGIAKGFAQDEALMLLRTKFNITSALLDAGGAVAVTGKPPGRDGWNVQLGKTTDSDPDIVLLVENTCVATSGDLRQSVEIDGVGYSHIIDKTTGLGMIRPTQASVVAGLAVDADRLATTLCLMGPEKGIEWLITHHPKAEARVLAKGGDGASVVRETAGFSKLILQSGK